MKPANSDRVPEEPGPMPRSRSSLVTTSKVLGLGESVPLEQNMARERGSSDEGMYMNSPLFFISLDRATSP